MGSGSSARNKYQTDTSASTGEKAEEQGPSKPTKLDHEAHEARAYHKANCTDSDLLQAFRILDCVEYDDTKKKKVEKYEKVSSGHRSHWGNVTIAKNVPKHLYCTMCKNQILDRDSEVLFFFCVRCKREDKKFRMCCECYNKGECATGERAVVEAGRRDHAAPPSAALAAEAPSQLPKRAWQQDATGPRLDAKDRQSGSKDSFQTFQQNAQQPEIRSKTGPSDGLWTGTAQEGKIRRPISVSIYFQSRGVLTGSCTDDGCALQGKWGDGEVSWIEQHDWGQTQVSGRLFTFRAAPTAKSAVASDPRNKRQSMQSTNWKMTGNFEASDGGSGTLELIFSG